MKIIECPRDAMQGIDSFIDTDKKIHYINQLLSVGFDTLDMGSFVSPNAVPQMRDTEEVIKNINLSQTKTKLLTIVGNIKGAKKAAEFDEIDYLGFPFSVSNTFQKQNINSDIEDSFNRVQDILNICIGHNKELVLYISMAFGNPYHDPWNADIVCEWASKFYHDLGIRIISLSDTVGVATPETITYMLTSLIPELPKVAFGVHLHTQIETWEDKVAAAVNAGCTRFDGALKGYGGCPMAMDHLIGNMPTENLIDYFNRKKIDTGIDQNQLRKIMLQMDDIFPI